MADSSIDVPEAGVEVQVTAVEMPAAESTSTAQQESGGVTSLSLRFSQIDLDSVKPGCCDCGFAVYAKKWINFLLGIYNFVTDLILLNVLWVIQNKALFGLYLASMIINFLYDIKHVRDAQKIAKKDEIARALAHPVVAELYILKSKQYHILMEVVRRKMPFSARVALFVYRTLFKAFETLFLSPLNLTLIGLTLNYGQTDFLPQSFSNRDACFEVHSPSSESAVHCDCNHLLSCSQVLDKCLRI
jgi:hypothetical protein